MTIRFIDQQQIEVDAQGNVGVKLNAGAGASTGTVTDNRKVVTTAGTAVQLPSQACKRVFVQAETDNTGIIAVGGSTVVAAEGTQRGMLLFPSNGQWFNVNNSDLLWLDSTVSGEGVSLFYEV